MKITYCIIAFFLMQMGCCEESRLNQGNRGNRGRGRANPIKIPRMSGSQKELLIDLLKDYDINEWPQFDLKEATEVRVQLFINSFGSLNAANMDYSLDAFLRQRWRDPRLMYSGGRPSFTIMEKKIQDQIWKPDTFFENVKEAAVHQVTMPNLLLRIDRDGSILYSIRVKLRLSCSLKLQQYPLDSQVCHLALASYANTADVIKYIWNLKSPIEITEGLSISQFDLLDMHTVEKTYKYDTGNFSGLHVLFSLRRQNGYHVLQTYIPTILIVSISWVSFWLDPNAVPGRVSLGVTTLLTLTTLAAGIRQQLPPVSYVKAIDVWIGVCMIMVFGALLEFTLANWMANRKIPAGKTPPKIPDCLMCLSYKAPEHDEHDLSPGRVPKAVPTTYLAHARALDRVCRVMFPGSFFLFNIIYWPYYMYNQYKDPFLDL